MARRIDLRNSRVSGHPITTTRRTGHLDANPAWGTPNSASPVEEEEGKSKKKKQFGAP